MISVGPRIQPKAYLGMALMITGVAMRSVFAQPFTPCVPPNHVQPLAPEQESGALGPILSRQDVQSYILSLSWSPTYCAGARRTPDNHFQCVENQFGFVVHGLWPEGHKKPRLGTALHCVSEKPIAPVTYKNYLCTVPSMALMMHQWQKHGVCVFQTPDAYFKTIQSLYGAIHIPNFAQTSTITAGNIRNEFIQRNPTLAREAIMIVADRKNRLREVRFCYDQSLRLFACKRRGVPDFVTLRL